ncbi:putative teichuronic acid biosynthesis glycosyltransferase TuaG [Flavobacterium sp. ACN2]|jgi:teichuronic acid biosynthesis glycosyltransferase TuaG|uniref:glycosyltransferase family 2 protein n=1 Tax=unclassified Flavobacterium TaxID=196869 RepID=UPI000BB3CF06|nr:MULTISPECIES: glycosyltransferase family 2 protein [unclassified Flavobacterium]MDY0989968.1 glycosyltransferase family 2 protein [Flavobacterium sp. CFBP9031]PBI86362.1 putative teichuronic acid biosynthesis glycosyltransferase TuaG [Flavobacterium sp. ACN2]
MNDLVSILTPTYNTEKFIRSTIESAQNQTYTNWEMILVDDASTDNTVAIIEEFVKKDSRIKLFKLPENRGNGFARNAALEKATGKYIAYLDADDLWFPEKLEKQIQFLKANNLHFTFSFYDSIDEDGNNLNRKVESPNPLTYKQLFFCNYVGNLTAIYDADYFGKIILETSQKRQDWRIWLTILKQIKIAKPVPESLAFYRIRKDSVSSSKFKLIKHNFGVYREFHGYNFVFSILLMIRFLFTQLIIKSKYIKKI